MATATDQASEQHTRRLQAIADAASMWFRDWARTEQLALDLGRGDWTDCDAHRRFIAVLRSGRARVHNGRVLAEVTTAGLSWDYLAWYALDAASNEVPACWTDAAHITSRGGRAFLTLQASV